MNVYDCGERLDECVHVSTMVDGVTLWCYGGMSDDLIWFVALYSTGGEDVCHASWLILEVDM